MTDPRAAGDAGAANAAAHLLGHNLRDRPDKIAFIADGRRFTFGELGEQAALAAAALRQAGLYPGDRVVLCLLDGVSFVAAFLGAIQSGVTPVPINTLFRAPDYAHILADCAAKAAIVSGPLHAVLQDAARQAGWGGKLIVSAPGPGGAHPASFEALLQRAKPDDAFHPAGGEAIAFWLYSSGSTGKPKGVLHRHASIAATTDLYARQVLDLRESDVIFSAAKLYHAYGLGNALTFPLAVGATTVLHADRITPAAAFAILRAHGVSVFFGAPTLYAAMLAHPEAPAELPGLRLCVSAGESLPRDVGQAWAQRYGVDIVDGIGSTEMLHIFVTNRPGAVRYGATGAPTPGYRVRLLNEAGAETAPGEIGELFVSGPSSAAGYWNNPQKTADTFRGEWVRTGDKFLREEDGAFVFCGRGDDMLKVSGNWVSPSEVESALIAHPAVLEAAVIGAPDENGLTRAKAFVTLKPGAHGDAQMAEALRAFTKERLAPYKYPRLIEFVDELPKTATGKIQRHLLRGR
ncbi:MAG: benzoate-CoA ligase family protein [Hyphomonadaceae bacterium]